MVAYSQVKKVLPEDLRLDILPAKTKRAFSDVILFDFLKPKKWYLAGGTALALQAGHRQSVDLDFFTTDGTFEPVNIERFLLSTKKWVTTYNETGTLYGEFKGAKMSFIAYPFFHPSADRIQCGKITILSPDDIAAMKIIAVSQRGKKRGFIDLYWYANFYGSLEETIKRAARQYPEQKHSLPHFLKSLVYFTDAESDSMPVIFFDADWKNIKAYFSSEVPKIAKRLMNLTRN